MRRMIVATLALAGWASGCGGEAAAQDGVATYSGVCTEAVTTTYSADGQPVNETTQWMTKVSIPGFDPGVDRAVMRLCNAVADGGASPYTTTRLGGEILFGWECAWSTAIILQPDAIYANCVAAVDGRPGHYQDVTVFVR